MSSSSSSGAERDAIYCDYADIELVKNVFAEKKSPSFEAEMEKSSGIGGEYTTATMYDSTYE